VLVDVEEPQMEEEVLLSLTLASVPSTGQVAPDAAEQPPRNSQLVEDEEEVTLLEVSLLEVEPPKEESLVLLPVGLSSEFPSPSPPRSPPRI